MSLQILRNMFQRLKDRKSLPVKLPEKELFGGGSVEDNNPAVDMLFKLVLPEEEVVEGGAQSMIMTRQNLLMPLIPSANFGYQFKGQQGRVEENELELFYMKSHGTKLARIHMHDWLILLLLAIIEIILNIIHPFYRFVGKDMMTDLKYPMKDNTVPLWAVPVYAVLLPILVFIFIYFKRRDVHDLHHAILGLLFSVLITGVLTDAIKDATGRPRPDFFWRCFPDGVDNYDQWGNVVCHGQDSDIREGHKSFPSGHSSWSFAGLGFLALYLAGKVKVFDRRGHVAKLCIVFLPLLMASLVAVSRVDDYWHHWQDVFAGGILGLTVAIFCYLQFFPAPYHSEGWGPYAYFRALEETRSNRRVDRPAEEVGALGVGISDYEPNPLRNDVESGKL